MTQQEQLNTIRAAIMKANPEIEDFFYLEGIGGSLEAEKKTRPIRLADVLLAIDNHLPSGSWITAMGHLCFHEADTDNELVCWNLRKDRLEDQSPECVAFIANLLKEI